MTTEDGSDTMFRYLKLRGFDGNTMDYNSECLL